MGARLGPHSSQQSVSLGIISTILNLHVSVSCWVCLSLDKQIFRWRRLRIDRITLFAELHAHDARLVDLGSKFVKIGRSTLVRRN